MSTTETQAAAGTDDHAATSTYEDAAFWLRAQYGEDTDVVELGTSSVGINLRLTNKERAELLDELTPAIRALGFA